MYESVVLKKLRNDEPVWCAAVAFKDPNTVEILGHIGAHCVWICTEHRPLDIETVHNHVRAAKMMGMDSMVRVARGSYSDYIRPLELDATGIMVPHCMSGEEAAHVVRTTRFQPIGMRPMDGGNSDGPFCMLPVAEYCAFANSQRFIVIQIEDKEAVDCMEDIVAVDHIDVIFLGPGDLSHSYGVPGEYEHPKVLAAIDKLAALCKKYNRHWGMPCPPAKAPELIKKGARFLAAGSDVGALAPYFRDLREQFKTAGLTFESDF